jgi:hypothetical protein
MKKVFDLLQSMLFIIPLIIAIMAAFKSSILIAIVSIVIMLGLTICLPICKGNENLWAFIATSMVTFPIDLKFINILYEYGYIDSQFSSIIISVLVFFVLLSIEEISIGVFIRIIKPHQIDFEE